MKSTSNCNLTFQKIIPPQKNYCMQQRDFRKGNVKKKKKRIILARVWNTWCGGSFTDIVCIKMHSWLLQGVDLKVWCWQHWRCWRIPADVGWLCNKLLCWYLQYAVSCRCFVPWKRSTILEGFQEREKCKK